MINNYARESNDRDLISLLLRGNDVDIFEVLSGVSEKLSSQRRCVQGYLESGEKVYGFSTLLGHLDYISSVAESQTDLFEGHLVGPTSEIDEFRFKMISYAKLAQLANGSSGISPTTFRELSRRTAAWRGPAVGNWHGSYSSGDVVQGAWWVKNIIGDVVDQRKLPAGDLIAMINGNFVSTGTVISLIPKLQEFFSRAIEIVALMSDSGTFWFQGSIDVGARSSNETGRKSALWLADTQPPVSLRDSCPVLELIKNTWSRLLGAVRSNLSSASGNPLFEFQEEATRAINQSSFLNFGLSQELLLAVDSVSRVGAYVQRYIEHFCSMASSRVEGTDKIRFVQPPKVATGILTRLSAGYAQATIPTLSESLGIEDICDESLRRAELLGTSVGLALELVDIFDSCLAAAQELDVYSQLCQESGIEPWQVQFFSDSAKASCLPE